MKSKLIATIFTAALMAVSATACSGTSQRTPTPPSPGVSIPQKTLSDDSTGWKDVLTIEKPVKLLSPIVTTYKVLSPQELEIEYTAGNATCYGVAGRVKETPTTIIINFTQGTFENVTACTDEARVDTVMVPLDEPVGNRKIVDSANNSVAKK